MAQDYGNLLLADAVNAPDASHNNAGTTDDKAQGTKHYWNYATEFSPHLHDVLTKNPRGPDALPEIHEPVELFVECCRAVGYLWASYRSGCIDLRAKIIDADFLISNLFGLQTGISGFDELFGGGLMLAEEVLNAPSSSGLGRIVLINGRFGTGKSLLSLQLAVEVARKGGLAWVMPLEQSLDDCLYTLESMRVLPEDNSVIIATDTTSAEYLLQGKRDERGALIILNTIKESYDDFLTAFVHNVNQMKHYPLRLISVDPLNSIYRDEAVPIAKLRAQTMEMIEKVKRSGTNVLLIAEESTDPRNEFLFEQNIADTVIRLSTKESHDYT